MISVKRSVTVKRDSERRVVLKTAEHAASVPEGRIPRISRLMALAIHCDRLLREGKVESMSELARLAHVTQPRMTQIMNLNLLAPDIQEEILHLPLCRSGRDHVTEKGLRRIVAMADWGEQRRLWRTLSPHASLG